MIKLLLTLLKTTEIRTKNIDIALGINKYPENFTELKNYLKLRYNGRK